MPIPNSGALSLSTIQTEFGGANPISLSEYYAGGGLVPAGTSGINGAVPSSGAISISRFYGTAALAASINDQFVFSSTVGAAGGSVLYQLNSNGNVETQSTSAGSSTPETWRDAGASSSFEVRATLVSGSAPTNGTLNTWLSLSVIRGWSNVLGGIGSLNSVLLIEIRIAGGAVLDSATVTLTAESEF